MLDCVQECLLDTTCDAVEWLPLAGSDLVQCSLLQGASDRAQNMFSNRLPPNATTSKFLIPGALSWTRFAVTRGCARVAAEIAPMSACNCVTCMHHARGCIIMLRGANAQQRRAPCAHW